MLSLYWHIMQPEAVFGNQRHLWSSTPWDKAPASNGICAGSSLTGRVSGADITFTELSVFSPAKKPLANRAPHVPTPVCTREVPDRWMGEAGVSPARDTALLILTFQPQVLIQHLNSIHMCKKTKQNKKIQRHLEVMTSWIDVI